MELKEMILQTLAEIDAAQIEPAKEAPVAVEEPVPSEAEALNESAAADKASQGDAVAKTPVDELRFLENLRERILVLFEGFQAPNNKHFEAKLDLTLNFFEYLLATIEKRVEELRRA